MEHTIIIWRKLKTQDSEGQLRHKIERTYRLTEEEICENETAKHIGDIDKDSEYEYYAEIAETKHS